MSLATPKQVAFISDLIDRKNLFASPRHFDTCNAMDAEEYAAYIAELKQRAEAISKDGASQWIDSLLKLPDNEEASNRRRGQQIETDIPAGHYAVTGEDGTTDFYRVDRPTKGRWEGYTFVKLQLSDDYQNLSRKNAQAILAKIAEAGPREAAIRYGHELGHCAICNRTLTNPDSIEAGIGPVCAENVGW